MNLDDIFEARRNPETNQDGRDVVNSMSPYFFNERAFLSMIDVHKVGVHPTTPYSDTPTGVYAYPLAEQHVVSLFLNNRLPHARDARYAAVLLSRPEINALHSDMSEDECAPYRERLDALMVQRYDPSWLKMVNTVLEGDFKATKPAHALYNATHIAAITLSLLKRHSVGQLKGTLPNGLWNYRLRTEKSKPAIWNGVLRTIGFDAVDDRGSSMIHSAEPFQTCFLSTSAFSDFKIFRNDRSGLYGHKLMISSAGHFLKLVARGQIKPEDSFMILNAILNGQSLPNVSDMGGYEPGIVFSDAQITGLIDWCRTKMDWDGFINDRSTKWNIKNKRLRTLMGMA